MGTVGVGVMQRWSANDGGAPLHHCAAQQPPVGILFFCTKPLLGQNSTMATSLAAGRAPRPRARPPRRPRHQAPPRGRAGTPVGGQPSWAPRGVASRGCETTSCFTRFHDVFSLALPTATGMASPPAAHAGGQNLALARTWLEPGWHTLAHTGTQWLGHPITCLRLPSPFIIIIKGLALD